MTYATSDDGVRLHYQVTGRRGGPPVLLIQGLGADKHGWDLQRLAIALYPPHDRPRQPGRRAQRQAATAPTRSSRWPPTPMAVLDHAGVETAHVVGASMGGAITQILALM